MLCPRVECKTKMICSHHSEQELVGEMLLVTEVYHRECGKCGAIIVLSVPLLFRKLEKS